jgi:UDP-N-acetylmuramate--alanine ligase
MSNEPNIKPAMLETVQGIRSIYFIGIGGIGMSALARYFKTKGVTVTGYDKTETALTKALVQEGIPVTYEDDVRRIPKDVGLVVYTPAIPKDHAGLNYYRQHDYKVVKRSDVLGAITHDAFNVCVAGTHGKTTISTMIAHVLRHTGYGCNAFLGGISANYGTNFWSSASQVCVVEADEYDRSFLKLSPDVAIISAMDADHLDIYGDEASMQDSFVAFGNRIKEGGLLLSKFGLRRIGEIKAAKKLTYSASNDAADVFASKVQINEGGYVFDVQLKDEVIAHIELKVGGMHNVENAVAAIAVAHHLKINSDRIKEAVAAFRGVKRRFEYVLPVQKKVEGGYVQPVMIDDYAHHPEELRALLQSVRSLFPQRRVTVIFQPHLFSRTRDFADGFAESLGIADEVVLLPIYPARELPIEGISSATIAEKMNGGHVQILEKQAMLDWAKKRKLDKEFGEVLVVAGAGDIDALVQPLKQIIEKA